MKPRVMAELLSQYIDRLNAGRDDTAAYLSLFDSQRTELAPMFSMVKMLRGVLVKSEPSAVFIETLGMGLQAAAQEAVAKQRYEQQSWAVPASRRNMVLGAAALGSLAWIAAILVFKSRTPTSAKRAA